MKRYALRSSFIRSVRHTEWPEPIPSFRELIPPFMHSDNSHIATMKKYFNDQTTVNRISKVHGKISKP